MIWFVVYVFANVKTYGVRASCRGGTEPGESPLGLARKEVSGVGSVPVGPIHAGRVRSNDLDAQGAVQDVSLRRPAGNDCGHEPSRGQVLHHRVHQRLALLKERSLVGVYWGDSTKHDPGGHLANLKQLNDWFSTGKIKPVVSERYPLATARDAVAAIANRQVKGKVVVVPRG